MEKQATIEKMLELIYTIKLSGMRGAGYDAVHELKGMCEKLLAIHASQKRASGHLLNGDESPFNLVTNDPDI